MKRSGKNITDDSGGRSTKAGMPSTALRCSLQVINIGAEWVDADNVSLHENVHCKIEGLPQPPENSYSLRLGSALTSHCDKYTITWRFQNITSTKVGGPSILCNIIIQVESTWNLMAHGNAREGKWRGNWGMEWVASTLHTTSEYGVSSTTTADTHTSAAITRLNWRPCRFKWTRPFRQKTKSGFWACAITFQTQSTSNCHTMQIRLL